jgi:hypothetical protein
VYLIDDEHLVFARLRWDEDLLAKLSNVVHGVVAGRIKLVNVHASLLVESLATLAFSARLPTLLWVEAVDGLRKDACTSGFAHTSRPAEQVCMSQLA